MMNRNMNKNDDSDSKCCEQQRLFAGLETHSMISSGMSSSSNCRHDNRGEDEEFALAAALVLPCYYSSNDHSWIPLGHNITTTNKQESNKGNLWGSDAFPSCPSQESKSVEAQDSSSVPTTTTIISPSSSCSSPRPAWLSKYQIFQGVLPLISSQTGDALNLSNNHENNKSITKPATNKKEVGSCSVSNSSISSTATSYQIPLPEGVHPLPLDFKPSKLDIVVGAVGITKCAGNVRFRQLVQQHVHRYTRETPKTG
ncbi:hypothetical protein ACA910_004777 [Epithemia clementina (nom. ined.)]